jgi:hypothetical protein
MIEVDNGDVRGMENRVIDYVRQVVTENVIKELTRQFLADEEFIKAVKETVKKRVEDLKITDMVVFQEQCDREAKENQ